MNKVFESIRQALIWVGPRGMVAIFLFLVILLAAIAVIF